MHDKETRLHPATLEHQATLDHTTLENSPRKEVTVPLSLCTKKEYKKQNYVYTLTVDFKNYLSNISINIPRSIFNNIKKFQYKSTTTTLVCSVEDVDEAMARVKYKEMTDKLQKAISEKVDKSVEWQWNEVHKNALNMYNNRNELESPVTIDIIKDGKTFNTFTVKIKSRFATELNEVIEKCLQERYDKEKLGIKKYETTEFSTERSVLVTIESDHIEMFGELMQKVLSFITKKKNKKMVVQWERGQKTKDTWKRLEEKYIVAVQKSILHNLFCDIDQQLIMIGIEPPHPLSNISHQFEVESRLLKWQNVVKEIISFVMGHKLFSDEEADNKIKEILAPLLERHLNDDRLLLYFDGYQQIQHLHIITPDYVAARVKEYRVKRKTQKFQKLETLNNSSAFDRSLRALQDLFLQIQSSSIKQILKLATSVSKDISSTFQGKTKDLLKNYRSLLEKKSNSELEGKSNSEQSPSDEILVACLQKYHNQWSMRPSILEAMINDRIKEHDRLLKECDRLTSDLQIVLAEQNQALSQDQDSTINPALSPRGVAPQQEVFMQAESEEQDRASTENQALSPMVVSPKQKSPTVANSENLHLLEKDIDRLDIEICCKKNEIEEFKNDLKTIERRSDIELSYQNFLEIKRQYEQIKTILDELINDAQDIRKHKHSYKDYNSGLYHCRTEEAVEETKVSYDLVYPSQTYTTLPLHK